MGTCRICKKALEQLGMIYDVERNVADYSEVGLKGFALLQTTSGHLAIPARQRPVKVMVSYFFGPVGAQQHVAFVL